MGDENTFVKGMTYVAALVAAVGSGKLLWSWFQNDVWPWADGHRWWTALVVVATPFAVMGGIWVAGFLLALVDFLRRDHDYDDADSDESEATSYTLDDLEAMNPYAFEAACAALLVRDGFDEVEQVGGAGDLGADVLAWDDEGRKVVVQCKQYAQRVGSKDVQTFNGTARPEHDADVALIIGLNGFTGPARDFASRHGIALVDRAGLEDWADGTHLYDVIDVRFAA